MAPLLIWPPSFPHNLAEKITEADNEDSVRFKKRFDYSFEGTEEFQDQYEEKDEEVYGMNECNQSFCPEINKKLIDFSIDNAKSNIIMLLWLQEIFQTLN